MTVAEAPVPNEVPGLGDSLTFKGVDANGNPSMLGITSPGWSIDDPSGLFTFAPAADGSEATITKAGTTGVGTAVVTYTAGTTNADGTPGAGISVTWEAEILAGNAVSGQIVATPITAPPAPELFSFGGTDPTTIDVTAWPLASVVESPSGAKLYSWAGAGPAPTSAEWVLYTGPTMAPVATPVPEALALSAESISGSVGAPVTFQATATGGTEPYTFIVDSLPAGLTLDAQGALTGSPTAVGSTVSNVTVTDSAGVTATATLTITIA